MYIRTAGSLPPQVRATVVAGFVVAHPLCCVTVWVHVAAVLYSTAVTICLLFVSSCAPSPHVSYTGLRRLVALPAHVVQVATVCRPRHIAHDLVTISPCDVVLAHWGTAVCWMM